MVKNTIEKCISSGQPFDFEAVLVTTEKKELWVRANGIAEIVDGECLRMYGSVQDIDDRKEAEVRLQSLAGNLPAVVFQYLKSPDDTDALKNVSNGSYPIWGISPEEAYQNNQPVWDGIRDGGDFEKVQKSISDSIEMKTKWMCRYKYVMPSGELRTHLVSGTPAFLADGSVTFNSIILDVTQETKNEELLEQTSKIARVGSWELDLINQDGDRMYWSPMLFEIVEVEDNYNPTLTGGIEFHIGESKERIKNALDLLITDGTEFDEEILLLTAKGNERWIRAIGKSEMANNKRTKIYGSYQDIHERKKAEKKILKANERFEKVIDATNDSIWDWDLENDTKHRPQFVERFFEKKASKLTPINSCGPNNFHLEDFEKVQDSVQKAINDPACNRWELQYRVLNEKGVIHYVNDRGLIMRNSEGTAVRMIGAMSDISDIKRMTIELSELNQSLQQYTLELERSNEELEQFAFVASHDLQEPLRMISSFMDLLQRKYGDQLDDKGLQYIHFATDGARRMKQIILDLLEYSKAGSPLEEEEEVDVNEMLTEFRQSRRKMIAEKVASIKSSKLPNLNTYRAAMVQIFHCLLDNALKYTEEDTAPVIEVEAVENEREWEFSIKDNGIGIDPQFHDKIFVIFQRLHNNETYAGTGIGLSTAKKHVEFLNGRIWLESAPGKGTTFYFTIPKIN
jgi:signal transduction histidine kinase